MTNQEDQDFGLNNYEKYMQFGNPILAKMYSLLGLDAFLNQVTFAKGSWIHDVNGKAYLDLTAGIGVHNIGHNHPRIKDAICDFLDKDHTNILQIGITPYHTKLLEKIAEITPKGLYHSFIDMRGADVVEFAIKTARQYTKRTKILYLEGSFHGDTLGALSVTGNSNYQSPFKPLLPDCVMIPFNDLKAAEIELISGEYAGFIVEPIQGEAGIRIPQEKYLSSIRDLCTQNGTLLILDEIQTGLGRTGRMFACEHENVIPDILLIGKAISGGYIGTAVLVTTDQIWNGAYGTLKTCLLHSSTFSANSLQCLVAYETLKVIQAEDYASKAQKLGEYFLKQLLILKEKYHLIKEVRGKGLMIGIELEKSFFYSDFTSNFMAAFVGARLFIEERILAIYTLNNPNVIRIEPPLCITKEEIDFALAGISAVFSRHFKHEHFVTTTIADLIQKQKQIDPRFKATLKVTSIVAGTQTTITGQVKEMIDVNSFLKNDLQVHAKVNKATNEVNLAALRAAKLAAEDFYRTPLSQRREALLKWREKILDNYTFLVDVALREGLNYKSVLWQLNLSGSYTDIQTAYDRLNYFKELLSPKQATNDSRAVYYLETRPGVVGIAPAEKTALALGIMGITAAVHNGLSMIITFKNAITFSILIDYLIESFHDVGLPCQAINVIQTTDRELMRNWRLIKNKDIGLSKDPESPVLDFFAYWGPYDESLLNCFLSEGIKCCFDMNGNDCVIVHKDADLSSAIKDVISKFEDGGQICISPKRAFVHEDIKHPFIEMLNQEISKLKISLTDDPFNDIIPVFNLKDREEARIALKEAYNRGLVLYIHGEKVSAQTWPEVEDLMTADYTGKTIPEFGGKFLRPMVVIVDKKNSDIQAVRKEMFNTLLSIQFYKTIDEVLAAANDSEYGIRASFWTNKANYEIIDRFIHELDCGGVMINTPHLALMEGSSDLGGTKKSSHNTGPQGAKMMVTEFTHGLKYLQFQTQLEAQRFIAEFWKEEKSYKNYRSKQKT